MIFSLPKFIRTGMFIALMFTAVFIGGCSDDDENPVGGGSGTGTLLLNFAETVGSNPLVIQSSTTNFPDTTQAGNPFNVSELQYFVSDFRLHMTNGGVIGIEDFHYRNAPDPATLTYTWGGIPAGTYSAVSFTFGLDAEKNVDGGLGPAVTWLGWPANWGGGYHYMEFNGNYFDGISKGFLVHTGRRKMSVSGGVPSGPDSVAYHHFFEVKSDVTPFTIDGGDTWEVTFTMDILGWFKSPVFDMSVYFPSGQGIMVNLPAQALLLENGINNVYSASGPVKK